jgi:competence protein ComGC
LNKIHGPNHNGDAGFSIIELLTVTAIAMILMAIAIFELQPTWQQIQANAGWDQVKTTLRQARELAISQRRSIVVQFMGAGTSTPCPTGASPDASSGYLVCIELFQMQVVPGTPPTTVKAAAPFLTEYIEQNVQFISYAHEPDTPDSFLSVPPATGAAPTPPAGIYYLSGTGVFTGVPTTGFQFQSDGTFTDGNGVPLNLTLFLGELNIPTTARALTILGNTGRVAPYHGTGVAWFR